MLCASVNHSMASAAADRSRERESHMTQSATMTPEPQRLRALERANAVRLGRAELKRRIAVGEVSVAEVILAPPLPAQSWAVSELLMSQRRWGSTRCRKFLQRNHINEIKPLGQLTERQRRMLAAQLGTCELHELGLVDPVRAPADTVRSPADTVRAPADMVREPPGRVLELVGA